MRLATVMIRRTYSDGQIIFLEGNPARGIWFLLEGRVKIMTESLNGREQGLCLARAGKCFGGCPLFDGELTPATAQAIGDVTLIILPREESLELVANDPCLAMTILNVLNNRLIHLARLGESLGSRSVPARIRECLVACADETEAQPIVSLTHENLATLVGTAREVVSRQLSRLEQEGLILVEPGQITLMDVDLLSTPRLPCKN